MASFQRLGFAILIGSIAVALIFLVKNASLNKSGEQAGFSIERPRNQNPIGESTRYYKVKDAVGKTGRVRRQITYYWLEPPASHRNGTTYPLVLVLHGAPGNAYAGRYLSSPTLRKRHPAFVMIPVISQSSTWAFPDTMPFFSKESIAHYRAAPKVLPQVVDIIHQLEQQYPIDPARIYVIGCSEGGFGAFGAVRDFPDVFAASVPLSGGWNPEDSPRMTRIPVWAMHGRLDEGLPPEMTRDVAQLIHEYGGPIKYTEFADMSHECPSPRLYTMNMWDWMFSQRKGS